MVKNTLLVIMALIMSVTISYGTDVYARVNFDYEQGSNNEDVQIKVFKCQDSSCESGKVTRIPTEIYSQGAKAACFGNLNQAQMNNCMNNYRISGDKAPSSGMVVKFSGVNANTQQHYLISSSVKRDTFVTYSYMSQFQTTYNDYDYITNDISVDFYKVIEPRAEILQFQVKNLDNPSLPIQVDVEAGMRTTVCSAFVYNNGFHKPGFDAGYSDYFAKTDITLEIVDPQTNSIIESRTKSVNIEAGECTATHSFSWVPPVEYEAEEVTFRVRTEVVDEQAYNPKDDVQTKTVTVYPEDLTNACWVVADNLLIANDNPVVFNTQNLHITVGNDSYLSFDIESYKSLDQDGVQLVHNDYTVRVEFNDTLILDELVTSNAPTYYRDITNLVTQLGAGDYNVRVTVTPQDNGCSIRTPTVLTDILTVRVPPTPTPQNEAPEIVLPQEVSISGEDYTSTFSITDEEVSTVQTICYLNSYANARILDNTNRDNHFRVVERLTSDAFTITLSCYAVDEEGVLSQPDSQVISFEEINTNVAPTIDLGEDVLNLQSTTYTDNLYTKINDGNDDRSTLTTSCSINDTTRAALVQSGNVITITKLNNEAFSVQLDCRVEDPLGLFDTDSQIIEFDRDNSAPTIQALPPVVYGGQFQSVSTQLIAQDDVEVVRISCYSNALINADVDFNNIATFTRTVYTPINTTVTCEAEDDQGLTGITRVRVFFDESTGPINNAPVLNIPSLLNGNVDTQVVGGMSATDVEDGDLTNEIICTPHTGEVTVTSINGLLRVIRTTNSPIDTQVTCGVTDSQNLTTSQVVRVLFSEISNPTNNAPVLTVPSLLNGSTNSLVDGIVSATDVEDGDLTNQIICFPNSNLVTVDLTNGNLQVSRNVNTDISTTVLCTVFDSGSLSDTQSINVVFDSTNTSSGNVQNVSLEVNPTTVFTNENVVIEFNISDVENYVDCVLTSNSNIIAMYGNGACVGNFSLITSFASAGNYTIELHTEDSNGNIVILTETIEVIERLGPQGTLSVSPTNGFAPLNVVATYNITHPQGLNMTCQLLVNGVISGNDCQGTTNLNNLSEGTYVVRIIGIDSNGVTFELSETITVFGEENKLGGNSTKGNVTTNPIGNGQNNVTVSITNETVNNRITMIRPYLVTKDGIENPLRGGSEIGVKLHTQANNPDVNYNFVLDMTEFLFNVEYDETYTLVIEFRDNFGVVLEVNSTIVFEDTKQELKGPMSIRGQEIDFRGHLTTLLKESVFKPGQNRFGVVLANNENDVKKVTYTITGQNIRVQERGTYTLRANEHKFVPMSISLPQDVEPGLYTVRVTMEYDGIRESKLTYLKVGQDTKLPTYTIEDNAVGFNPVGEPSIK